MLLTLGITMDDEDGHTKAQRVTAATMKVLAPYIAALSLLLQDDAVLDAVERGDMRQQLCVLDTIKRYMLTNNDGQGAD